MMTQTFDHQLSTSTMLNQAAIAAAAAAAAATAVATGQVAVGTGGGISTGTLLAGPGALRASQLQAGLIRLSPGQQERVTAAKKFAMEQSIRSVLVKQTIQHQAAQAKTLQRHQALVLMCRVYVGSISFELREDTIRTAFSPFGPIKSINMSWDSQTQKHKGFAFVEYELPEAAQLALDSMNGVLLGGRNIKVGRPSNMPQAAPIIEQISLESRQYTRIFLSSVHPGLGEEDIREVFEPFGVIRGCRLVPDPSAGPGKHKGYGFIDYDNDQSVTDAIAIMNNYNLGGILLRVGRAITPPHCLDAGGPQVVTVPPPSVMPTAAAVAAAAATAKIQAMEAVGAGSAANAAASADPAANGESNGNNGTNGNLVIPPLATPVLVPSSDASKSPAAVAAAATSPQLMPPSSSVGQSASTSSSSSSHPLLPTPSIGLLGIAPPGHIPHPGLLTSRPPPPLPPALLLQQQQQLGETEGSGEQENQTLHQQENVVIKGSSARHMLMQKLMRKNESKVVVLKNMVGVEDVDEDLESEVMEECGKFGAVQKVIIYQEKQTDDDDDDDGDDEANTAAKAGNENEDIIVKIFVAFARPDEALKARQALNGRFFGGRHVVAEIYDQTLYDANDLSA